MQHPTDTHVRMWSFFLLALIAYMAKTSALSPHNMWGHSATAVCHLPELITNDVVLVGKLVCPSSSSTHRRDDMCVRFHVVFLSRFGFPFSFLLSPYVTMIDSGGCSRAVGCLFDWACFVCVTDSADSRLPKV